MIDFRKLFERLPAPYVLLDRNFDLVDMNSAYLQATARSREELVGRNMFEAFPDDPGATGSSSADELRASFQRVLDSGEADTLSLIRYSIPVRTGLGVEFEERYWSATHVPLPGADGDVQYILQQTIDVTELQYMKAELRARRQQGPPMEQLQGTLLARAQVVQDANRTLDSQRRHLLQLFDEAPGFMAFLRGPEHVFELANSAYIQLVGGRDVTGKAIRDALPDLDGQGYFELLDDVYRTGRPFVGRGMQVDIATSPGQPADTRNVDFIYQPVRESDGRIIGIFVQGHDITAQARTQAELERHQCHLEALVRQRTKELQQSEEALLHAQKLEAVGKLTGGVAHDFNNVLQVIGANLQLILASGPAEGDSSLRRRARSAMDAVDRGAKLSSQLLAFARQQPLRPVVFNMGDRLRTLDDLLRRTLGEPVELCIEVEEGLGNVWADVYQLENAVLNLAINARDAMPHGGRLDIVMRNVVIQPDDRAAEMDPGAYILLEVRDTGHGMSPAVLQRAFEPFFTTKGEGQGTGLGLSMVYGFAKQSGGHVSIHSARGQGTIVGLFLPRTDAPATGTAAEAPRPDAGRGETILVVEDDPSVRESAVDTLQSLGYVVVEAGDATEALEILGTGRRVDLLFTDVVMPGPIQSPELAERARSLQPGMAVLFTSGYTEDVVFHDGRLDPGIELIDKPYLRDELAARLRHLLGDRDTTRAQGGLRILLVEDDAANRALTAELLTITGHAVVAVGDASSGLRALQEEPFDVLLSDVGLPDRPGPALAREALELHPDLAVVFISGHSAEDLRASGIRAPVVCKPFHPDQLEAALQAAVSPVSGSESPR